jgi:hypothetical protein
VKSAKIFTSGRRCGAREERRPCRDEPVEGFYEPIREYAMEGGFCQSRIGSQAGGCALPREVSPVSRHIEPHQGDERHRPTRDRNAIGLKGKGIHWMPACWANWLLRSSAERHCDRSRSASCPIFTKPRAKAPRNDPRTKPIMKAIQTMISPPLAATGKENALTMALTIVYLIVTCKFGATPIL